MQVVLNQEMSKPVDERNWEPTQKVASMIEESGQRTPLQTSHSLGLHSRFSAGPQAVRPFEVLYLAENSLVAQSVDVY